MRYVGWLGKSHMFTAFIFTKLTIFHPPFSQCLTCQPGKHVCGLLIHESIWIPDSSLISCLNNVFTFLYIIIVYPCLIWYFCMCSCSLPCELFLLLVHNVCPGCCYYCCECFQWSMTVDYF